MNITSSFNTSKVNSPIISNTHRISPMFKCNERDSFERISGPISPEYVLLFEKVKHLEGKDFIRASYEGLADILGIKSVVSKNVYFPILNWLVPSEAKAAANPTNASITIYKGLFKGKDKWEQLSIVAHEAFHLQQYTDILRLEDVDKEAYIDAVTDLTYPLARRDQKKELRAGVKYGVNAFQKKALNLGTIKKDSPEGIAAQKLYKGLLEYPRMNSNATLEDYMNNPLEVEAYHYQDQVYDWAKQYFD